MAISVSWASKVINVNKADMVLIQSVPSEIYELNMNTFRLDLKDLEDSVNGMMFPDTHSHNPPVTISGAVLARVVEIVNDYTVTFEDGQYRVSVVGANTNIGERVNVNQVSVSTSNSAGLQDLNSLQAASFAGGVTIDVTSNFSGTTFPIGTRANPVNNLTDAMAIARSRGLFNINIASNLTITNEDLGEGFNFEGNNAIANTITLESGALISKCTFRNLTIQGVLDNSNILRECSILDITNTSGFLFQCALMGKITLAGGQQSTILDCFSGVTGTGEGLTAEIDMNGATNSMALRNFSGGLHIHNYTGSGDMTIDMVSGRVEFDSTIISGTFTVRGISQVVDNSTGSAIIDDSTETAVNKANLELNKTTIYHNHVHVDQNNGTAGTTYPLGTGTNPVNNMADALAIAVSLDLTKIKVNEDITITATDDISGFEIIGSHSLKSEITVTAGAITTFTQFSNCNLIGTLNGDVVIRECTIGDLSGFSGIMYQSAFAGTITLNGNKTVQLLDCFSAVPGANTPTLDFGVSGTALTMRNYNGGIKLENKSGIDACSIDMNSGQVIVNGTVTAGDIIIRGIAKVTDSSTGTANVVDETETTAITNMPANIWDTDLDTATLSSNSSAGSIIRKIKTIFKLLLSS